MTTSNTIRATLLVLYSPRMEECHLLSDPDGRTVEIHAT